MSNAQDNAPRQPEFREQPWLILFGVRQAQDGEHPTHAAGLIIDTVASDNALLPVEGGKMQVNMTIPAVSFGAWLGANLPALVHLWAGQHGLEMTGLSLRAENRELRERVQNLAGNQDSPRLHLVAPDGSKLN